MEIKRNILRKLNEWKRSEEHRPLIIHGARQIGKTWIIKKFGETDFRYTAYFNFDSSIELQHEFEKTKDARRLISILSIYCDVPIIAGETLIVFDEIQECPEALNSLKYFCEDTSDYHIIAAGSLLGVALHKGKGFPVGKVDFLQMYPVAFDEYFRTLNDRFAGIVEECKNPEQFAQLPELVKSSLHEAFNRYRICGGMPRPVVASLSDMGNERIMEEQSQLLSSFFQDFSKHAPLQDFPRIAQVWQSIPSQLAKENRKFVYKVVRDGARAREYETAISWLREAGLIYQVFCNTKPNLPLSAFDDVAAFKIYMLDCGLLRAMAQLPPEVYTSENPGFVEFKGALSENLVLQQMLSSSVPMPKYWVSNGTAELDFLIQSGLNIIPIEVKSGKNISGKSLGVYIKKYQPSMAVIVSENEFRVDMGEPRLFRIPFYLLPWAFKLL